MNPKVSIITAVFNGADMIAECIDSVSAQTHHDIEHIVIDGSSTDGTVEIVKKNRHRVAMLVSEPDEGIYDAMNKGLKLATGEIVAMLNSDDLYAGSSSVSNMVRFIIEGGLDAAYADLVYVDRNNPAKVTRFWRAGPFRKGAFRYGWVPPHPTFFCRRRIYEEYGYFRSHLQIAADFELMLRLMEKHAVKVGYLPEVLVKMRTGGKANRLVGITQGNREILDAFHKL
jgi:glycosyltransferase involved in cell wall biosynthesis